MSNVITIPSKTEVEHFGRHKLTVWFKPDAPDGERWRWSLILVKSYEYHGHGPTCEAARTEGRAVMRRYSGVFA